MYFVEGHSSPFLESFLQSFREEVPLVYEDRIMHSDIVKSVGFLDSIEIENAELFH